MTDKREVIHILEELAVLRELMGENPFKVRAFQNAARALQGVSTDLQELVEKGELTRIRGIGKSIAEVIEEVVRTGKSHDLEELKARIPAGLLEMLKIPGMGPKKVKAVWEKLGITTVGELEYACKENRLVDLEGFGAKTQEKILKGIELLRKYSERHLLSEARSIAEQVYERLKQRKEFIRLEIAGSLRRWKETIKDIDILGSSSEEHRQVLMDYFATLPEVETIIAKGSTKTSVVLINGINVDLRIVSDIQFPYALQYFTGSKEHNIALRELARKQGLKLNEYGLFRNETENIPCANEAEIFQQLGLQYIPPEIRENLGEIEAAQKGEIPTLVDWQDIRGIIHVHSHYSDGANSIEEMARAAREMGYHYLVISDHSRSAQYANGLSEERIREQHGEIDALNEQFTDFRILKSIECDILPDGSLDYDDNVLASFDLVIASIHSRFKMSEEEATERLLRAMSNPHVTIIGHPTGRLLLGREGYPVNIPRLLQAAAEQGVAIELNANPHRLDLDWRWLREAKRLGVRIAIGPDAHQIEGLKDIRYGVGIARKGWLEKQDVLNCLSAEELLSFARSRHTSRA